jgi:hypothetical protein
LHRGSPRVWQQRCKDRTCHERSGAQPARRLLLILSSPITPSTIVTDLQAQWRTHTSLMMFLVVSGRCCLHRPCVLATFHSVSSVLQLTQASYTWYQFAAEPPLPADLHSKHTQHDGTYRFTFPMLCAMMLLGRPTIHQQAVKAGTQAAKCM